MRCRQHIQYKTINKTWHGTVEKVLGIIKRKKERNKSGSGVSHLWQCLIYDFPTHSSTISFIHQEQMKGTMTLPVTGPASDHCHNEIQQHRK